MNLHPESSGLVFQKFHSFMHCNATVQLS